MSACPKLAEYRGTYCTRACISSEDDAWRVANIPGYQTGQAPLLSFGYVGVWDTVGALGVPPSLSIASVFNRRYEFHDLSLTELVKAARHAVAIDERRIDYTPTLWDNIDPLNTKSGFASDQPDAPYQQKWFPGNHGSVGGGGDRRGLSDQALEWIWDGARRAGLDLYTGADSLIYELQPSPVEYLTNTSPPKYKGLGDWVDELQRRADRVPGPQTLYEVSAMAQLRWKVPGDLLSDEIDYRPPTLSNLRSNLDDLPDINFDELPTGSYELYTIQANETLREIAEKKYGDAGK